MTVDLVLSLLGLIFLIVTGFLANNRYLQGVIRANEDSISKKNERVHERIDEIQKDFARKDDLMPHLQRIENSTDRTNARLDKFTSEITKTLSDLVTAMKGN